MTTFEHGPVQLFLIGFEGERPGPAVVGSIIDLVESETVALLDLVFVTRSVSGDVMIVELEDLGDIGLASIALGERGIAGDEDVDLFAEHVAPGTSAALITVELLWAKNFASALFSAGGAVLHMETVPAPVVNALLETASIDG